MLPSSFEILSLKDIGCEVILPEEQHTLEGNAHQKASYVTDHFGVDCFADDTGLAVDALGGAPGVYSARYAGADSDDVANYTKLLQALGDNENRTARFRTVICLIREQAVYYFDGIIAGTIIETPRGNHGFGYDPVFIPEGYHQTFAEMPGDQKNQISHRGIAIRKLVEFLT